MASYFAQNPGGSGAAPGLGRALVEFQEWEIRSGRVADGAGSRWWSTVNGVLLLDLAHATPGSPWELYAVAEPHETQSRLWEAHQWSIERGAAAAEGLLSDEPQAEREFIALALEMVERSAAVGYPTDSGDLGRQAGSLYPGRYPCSAAELERVEAALAELRG